MNKPPSTPRTKLTYAALVAVAFVIIGRAELLVSESFEYPPGDIVKQDGGSGWLDPWSGGRNVIEIESLSTAQGENPMASGGSLMLNQPDWASVRHLAFDLGEKPGIYYISLLIRNDTGVSKDNYGLILFRSKGGGKDGGFNFGQRHFGKVWVIGTSKGDAATVQSANEEAAFFVAKVTYSDTPGDDSILLFVNPALASEPADPDAEIGGLDLSPVNEVKLRSRMPFSFDELRFGTTWADVCPTP